MKKLALGVLLAGLAMFVWGALFWTVPFTYRLAFNSVPDEVAMGTTLKEALPTSGTYLLPDPVGDREVATERYASGPIAMLYVHRAGADPMMTSVFVFGFLHMLVSALFIALLLYKVKGALPTYRARFASVVIAGAAASLFSNLGDPIWWHQAWVTHLTFAAYDLVAWIVAGLVLAAFVKPISAPEPSEPVQRAMATS